MGKPALIFVDDQSNILKSLHRSLHRLEQVWDIHYASGGSEALRIIKNSHIDVIVADTNMPGMRGTQLLREVKSAYPKTIRLVLSGGCRNNDIALLLHTSHQFFSKPFDIGQLENTIKKLLSLRERVSNDLLKELVTNISQLPCYPDTYKDFRKELAETSPDLEKLGEYISKDAGLTAKLLQGMNTTFFGIHKAGIHPREAVQMMGPGTIAYLFNDDGHFNIISPDLTNHAFLTEMYERGLRRARLVEAMAADENIPEDEKKVAFTAGMLCGIGAIIMASEMADSYAQLIPLFKDEKSQCAEEQKKLGTNHCDVGAFFLGLWGFPDTVVNTATYYASPEKNSDQSLNLATLVHVADALVRTDDVKAQESCMNTAYLKKLGLGEKINKWRGMSKSALAAGLA